MNNLVPYVALGGRFPDEMVYRVVHGLAHIRAFGSKSGCGYHQKNGTPSFPTKSGLAGMWDTPTMIQCA